MTLTQTGLNYICQNFGNGNQCCVRTGLGWFYTAEGEDHPETGGTAQIVSRLASGLIDSLTMTNPARGIFTKAELDAVNGKAVTLQDAQQITSHDEPSEDQWCYGVAPPPPPPGEMPWTWIAAGAGAIIIVAITAYLLKHKR